MNPPSTAQRMCDKSSNSGRPGGEGARAKDLAVLADVPDFFNIGVWLRTIALVNGGALLAALIDAERLAAWWAYYFEYAWRLQPLLLLSLFLLALSSDRLRRLPSWLVQLVVFSGTALLAVVLEGIWRRMGVSDVAMDGVMRLALISGTSAWLVLRYLLLRHRAIRPAVDSAQVAALTARIRPHFLFNSLNAVLSLIRYQPQRAEQALESLAELFRVLMRDPRELVPLSEEISLCRQYLDLERLRLGERLRIEWAVDDVPADALVPPLILQPLLENAVYHGIEPADDGGEVKISFRRQDGSLRIEIGNSLPADTAGVDRHAVGNRMAIANIRERLALHYDLEARLDVQQDGQTYRVALILPYGRR